MKKVSCVLFLLLVGIVSAKEKKIDFSRDIQPLLSENCFHCHGPDNKNREANLRLDDEHAAKAVYKKKKGLIGIVPGHPEKSTIIERMFTDDEDDVMPPLDSNRTLTQEQKELIKEWIKQGAEWGTHWAFERAERPEIKSLAGTGNPIDDIVLEKLKEQKLTFSQEASKTTLLRRVSLDLTGVPPTVEELDHFINDKSPKAYEKAVDRLLASKRFGQKLGWDWLDAARYSDTDGFQGDPTRTMWVWRDWVVDSLNKNMPFDQFTVWQLAGDLLPNATKEQKMATAFNRNNMHNGEGGRIPEETRVESVLDRVETASTVWMGLTMGCCRCHDHKYDPLSHKEYFQMYDFFNQMSETGGHGGGKKAPVLDYATKDEQSNFDKHNGKYLEESKKLEKFEKDNQEVIATYSKAVQDFLKKPVKKRPNWEIKRYIKDIKEVNKAHHDLTASHLKLLEAKSNAWKKMTKVMVMDTVKKPRQTKILEKGLYNKPIGDVVSAKTPAILGPIKKINVEPGKDRPYNRLDMAHNFVSRDNPLTARVTVNRYWQTLFGRGIVKSVDDFGVQSDKPSNQKLIDWLAVEFMESGWDIKGLFKKIVTSKTYKQDSRITPDHALKDPENKYLSRGPRFRMPSYMLRDQALYVSGLMNEEMGGPSIKPYQPKGIWAEATFGKIKYKQDTGKALYRRSMYVFWRRIVGPTMFFDNSARQICDVKMHLTNTPLHALVTLNETTYVEAARVLAEKVMKAHLDDAERLNYVYRTVTSRSIAKDEMNILMNRLKTLKQQFSKDQSGAARFVNVGEFKRDAALDVVEHASWTVVCQLLLNLDETLNKE
ncbi:MAG: PSD1 and planctomycete cytochrome C domain-containing protein [Lentisphaeraceae bacterium]|nr:PSD1 and planctomycete cytochrome C domain-containing protein [Lentisphaeraceae bacterium]